MTFHDDTMPDDVSDDEAFMLTERHAPAEPGWYCGKFNCPALHANRSDRCDPDSDYWDEPDDADEDYYARAYNRELEEDMLGRPLFPNEY